MARQYEGQATYVAKIETEKRQGCTAQAVYSPRNIDGLIRFCDNPSIFPFHGGVA
jgi:hypothetical protein